jgi:hypothetical protein
MQNHLKLNASAIFGLAFVGCAAIFAIDDRNALAQTPGTDPASATEPNESLAKSCAEIFHKSGKSTRYLDALGTVISSMGKGGDTVDRAADQFADAMNDDPDPDALLQHITAATNIEYASAFQNDAKNWSFGKYNDRADFIGFLWRRAESLAKIQPDRSIHDARAAILLSVDQNFYVQINPLFALIKDENKLSRLAGIDAAKAHALNLLGDKRKQEFLLFADASKNAAMAIDQVTKTAKPALDAATVRSACDALSLAWDASVSNVGDRWNAVYLGWQLLNITKFSTDKVALQQVTAILEKWKNSTVDVDVKRWIVEALTHPIVKPHRLHQNGVMVNGKIQATD